MIEEKKGYSYNDLTIIPEVISNVSSRSECDCREDNEFLPIFTAPMASVVNEDNIDIFYENGINAIIPRNIDLKVRKKYMNKEHWVALSLKEFEDLFVNNCSDRVGTSDTSYYYICVDIANGHMKSLYEACHTAKKNAIAGKYELTIMTGNIANPKTYEWICKFNKLCNIKVIDYIRCGIGGGAGCFIDGTKIKTINGEKNIEDICKNDKVLTIDGTYQSVLSTTRFKSNELIKINNEITSTINHKYFVINKEDKNKVNEQNLQKYGYWLEANKLDKSKHLLIKIG